MIEFNLSDCEKGRYLGHDCHIKNGLRISQDGGFGNYKNYFFYTQYIEGVKVGIYSIDRNEFGLTYFQYVNKFNAVENKLLLRTNKVIKLKSEEMLCLLHEEEI